MPKYSLDEILDILKNLTPEEKAQLQEQLPAVLDGAGAPASRFQKKTQPSPFTGSIRVREGNAFAGGQVSAEAATNLEGSSAEARTTEIQEALDLLRLIKKGIVRTSILKNNQKKNLESTLEVVLEELKKDKPDKDLIDLALESLEKGLRGVDSLAGPTREVAQIIATAWLRL
ncbi:hypothetical protein [Kamptonema formosum]|uniref:hypothetical protein n=1 Tax=Kamptonema formosum TaxID=331992 RepID=UPI0003460106|nr:hypothetical protein [Oscillatoria sp. PCC 10802]